SGTGQPAALRGRRAAGECDDRSPCVDRRLPCRDPARRLDRDPGARIRHRRRRTGARRLGAAGRAPAERVRARDLPANASGGRETRGVRARARPHCDQRYTVGRMTTKPRLELAFVSDVACPWCAIGLASLEQALARVDGDVEAMVRIEPFELNPDMGPEGADVT